MITAKSPPSCKNGIAVEKLVNGGNMACTRFLLDNMPGGNDQIDVMRMMKTIKIIKTRKNVLFREQIIFAFLVSTPELTESVGDFTKKI